MKDHVWKPRNPKFQLLPINSWRVIKITLWCVPMVLSQNIAICILVIFHQFFLQHLYIIFIVISQKIENFLLYQTVYKDIFFIPSQLRWVSIYWVVDYSKIEFGPSISRKRVSRMTCPIFFDSRFWKSVKNCIECCMFHFDNSLIRYLIFWRNPMDHVDQYIFLIFLTSI